ncbi:Tetratricopeptide repeat-containing protein [Mariniphaga anaerophila]|uniref:Tetratricopeptide repeat-containing protein n=1 Tax=Mariniphaga anaerophila TaxID=1484053 RepID=A0A1M4TUI0_9BACT|nr:tetratricopeptide repeat protein [Mariniphaga anaerophila]SHE48140.1 Tetratricopeptide repeat-containing protein [Mariniphaga anaerophila]
MKRVFIVMAALLLSVFSFAQDAAEKINQANEALKAEDYAKAFTLYDEAMKNIGDVQVEPAINFNIGFAAYKSDNLQGTIEYLDKAIEAGVNVSKSYEYKALAYGDKKDFKSAVENYEKAIAADEEKDPSLVFNAAIAAYRGELLDKAVELFSKSVESGYRGETALFYKAMTLRKQNKDDEYKATLEKGVAKFPGDDKISSALANIYVSEGNDIYKKGVAILTAANGKVSSGAITTADDAYTAEVEKAKTEFKSAVEVLEKAKAIDAGNKNAQKLIDACNAVLES